MTYKEKLIWFTGLFEGEGSFKILKEKYVRGIVIPSTDLDVLEKVKSFFGGEIYKTSKRKKHWKESWVWSLASVEAEGLVREMIPFLLNRRADRAITWLKLYEQRNVKNKKRKERNSFILYLHNQGLTQKQIANKVGIERSGVSKIINAKVP